MTFIRLILKDPPWRIPTEGSPLKDSHWRDSHWGIPPGGSPLNDSPWRIPPRRNPPVLKDPQNSDQELEVSIVLKMERLTWSFIIPFPNCFSNLSITIWVNNLSKLMTSSSSDPWTWREKRDKNEIRTTIIMMICRTTEINNMQLDMQLICMVIQVVEFSSRGYKIGNIFA